MIVRAATETDLPAILAIYNHAVLHGTATAEYEPVSLESYQKKFAYRQAHNLPWLVAIEPALTSSPSPLVEGETERETVHGERGAMEAGRVVGWSALSFYHERIGYRFTVENSVYVAPDAQGKGVGKALLAPLIEAARERGFHVIVASIDSANEASRRLHARFGFVEGGCLPQIITKFGQWLDCAYMTLRLNDDAPPAPIVPENGK